MFKILMLIVCVTCSAASMAKLAQAAPFSFAPADDSAVPFD